MLILSFVKLKGLILFRYQEKVLFLSLTSNGAPSWSIIINTLPQKKIKYNITKFQQWWQFI